MMRAPAMRINGITVPKRGYAVRHLPRLMPLFASALRPRAKVNADNILTWSGFRGFKLSSRRRHQILTLASANPYANWYHHPWHTITVVMNAAVLADMAGLASGKRDELIFAALCHDLDHRGKHASMVDFAEERRAAAITIRTAFGPGSGRGQCAARLSRHLDATAAAWQGEMIDEVTALLRDADVMGSVFHPLKTALDLSRGVTRERNLGISAEKALKGFLGVMSSRGFSHPATSRLAQSISASRVGAGHVPSVAKTLGFRGDSQS